MHRRRDCRLELACDVRDRIAGHVADDFADGLLVVAVPRSAAAAAVSWRQARRLPPDGGLGDEDLGDLIRGRLERHADG